MNAGIFFIENSRARAVRLAGVGGIVHLGRRLFLHPVCILFVLVLVALWRVQAKRGKEPGELGKIAIGFAIAGLANLAMIVPAMRADAGAQVSLFWPILLYAVNAFSFLFYWPTLLALILARGPAGVTMRR